MAHGNDGQTRVAVKRALTFRIPGSQRVAVSLPRRNGRLAFGEVAHLGCA